MPQVSSWLCPAGFLKKQIGSQMKGLRQRQMNLMRVDYLFQNWLQTTQKILKLIANNR